LPPPLAPADGERRGRVEADGVKEKEDSAASLAASASSRAAAARRRAVASASSASSASTSTASSLAAEAPEPEKKRLRVSPLTCLLTRAPAGVAATETGGAADTEGLGILNGFIEACVL